jgi:hypothetical protein
MFAKSVEAKMQLVSDKLLDDEGDKTHAWFVKT